MTEEKIEHLDSKFPHPKSGKILKHRTSTLHKKLVKYYLLSALTLVVIAGIYVKYNSKITVTENIDTVIGLAQRAQAFHKAMRYDDWVDATPKNKENIFRPLVFYPIKPSDEEMNYAGDFFTITNEIYFRLIAKSEICYSNATAQLPLDAEINYKNNAMVVSDFIRDENNADKIAQMKDTQELVVIAFKEKFPCQKNEIERPRL